jgi:glycogen operon protein
MLGELATRLSGSSDLFEARARRPSRSINFVTAHDGFTLADLVAYSEKHNEANGEHNRDGSDNNLSWNHGVEGPTDDTAVSAARQRDVRSLLATLLSARGTPMLSMGDELGRTQRGNNNAYAQDNPLAWVDWDHVDDALIDFVAALSSVRHAHPALHADRFLTGAPIDASGIPDVEWRLPDGHPLSGADWHDPAHRAFAAVFYAPATDESDADRVLVAFNASDAPSALSLPDARAGCAWRCLVDTSLPGGRPLGARVEAPEVTSIAARSVVIVAEEPTIAWKPRRSGVEPAVLNRLAIAAGIAGEWWDVGGTRHDVNPDTKRALLEAMGLGATSTEDARARLVELAERGGRGPLPETLVIAEGTGATIALALDGAAGSGKHWLHIVREDGSSDAYSIDTAALPATTIAGSDGRRLRRTLTLPALASGTHRLFLDDDRDRASMLIVAPTRCHTPDDIAGGGRRFGLAAHLYSLRRPDDQGVGDFTTLAEAALATARAGGTLLGLNPLHALFSVDRERASPYHPSDRRFVDPIYVDVERVTDFDASREARAVLSANRRALTALAARDDVDYVAVWQAKRAVLDACFATFDRRPDDDPLAVEFEAFVQAGGAALREFATFEAIAAAHPRVPWQRWPAALRSPGAPHVAEFALQHARDLRFACYLQWQADRQLRDVAAKARAAGLAHGLYRDLAIGAAADGAEAWSNVDALARGVSIGAPPDPFSPTGQVWDLPPAIPHRLTATAYAAFRELLAANMRHAGALRIDHVMGLARLFWVPEGARAGDGAYVAYPFDDLLAVLALESHRARCLVVGEDLGTVPEGLRDRLAAADVLSYRVLWFERDGDGFRAPADYPVKAAACVSTHDLPTIAGWWSGADIDEKTSLGLLTAEAALAARAARAADRKALVAALAREAPPGEAPLDPAAPHDASVTAAVHRFVAATPAEFVLFQADDLAGETTAQNLPGTDRERPNWRRRTSVVAARLWDTRAGRLTCAACAARSAPQVPDRPAVENDDED